MKTLRKSSFWTGFMLCLLAWGALASTNEFVRQTVTLPSNAGATLFVDIDGDHRADLLAIEPVTRNLFVYRQRTNGFANTPDQMLKLPENTGWVGVCDLATRAENSAAPASLDLVVSTATGLYCRHQTNGVFESESHLLLKADQVFTNVDSIRLVSLTNNHALPVISASQTAWFRRDDSFKWKLDDPIPLVPERTSWRVVRNAWTAGANSSSELAIQESFRTDSGQTAERQRENALIKKVLAQLKSNTQPNASGTNRVDLNGDGQTDLVLYQLCGDRDPRTDVYVFLREKDGRWPERPSQVVHCRGFPIPVGETYTWCPVADLKGDGHYELVLLELKSVFTSASSLVEALVSHGLEWELTIRTFQNGSFSRTSDASIPLRMVLSLEQLREWPLFICGDFNGDGRLDFVVQRSSTQWNAFFSTKDGHWFAREPSATFEAPVPGFFDVADLKGDRQSDLILHAYDDARLFIFFPPPETKGVRR